MRARSAGPALRGARPPPAGCLPASLCSLTPTVTCWSGCHQDVSVASKVLKG